MEKDYWGIILKAKIHDASPEDADFMEADFETEWNKTLKQYPVENIK